jgi:predicted DNA-binding transcriptional regulator YafY
MPKNKEALKRYRIIHNVLKRGGNHKTSRIVDICNDAGIPVKLRTVQKDLDDLAYDTELGFFLPIKKDSKTKAYYYEYIPQHIFPSLNLDSDEITALLFYAKTINQYKEYPLFDKINEAVQKVINSSNISPEVRELFEMKSMLETEIHPLIIGIDLIPEILNAIAQKKLLELDYQRFNDEIKKHRIKPILLKEDKKMWYIVGINVKRDALITLALDRIIDVSMTEINFEPTDFNSKEHYKHSFGITVSNDEPLEVIIRFNPRQGNYLRTLPMHSSQEIIEDDEEKFLIKVLVKPSYEFYSKIFSYGSDALIISPKTVADKVLKTFQTAIQHYNKD